jgi:hypothetical protein
MHGTAWHEAYRARAEAHWTPERTAALTGGKRLLVTPREAPGLLRAMGVLDEFAALHPSRVRKYRQINHLLSFLRPSLDALDGDVLHLVDAGCGRSALGFLVSWWLERHGRPHRLLGVDVNPDVVRGCQERAEIAGLGSMAFRAADLRTVDLAGAFADAHGADLHLDALLALHACDTATDHALAMAVRHRARFFAVAPCCQAELARAWAAEPGPLGLLQRNPHLRRTVAASTTDALRAELMGARGYEVKAVEFVEAHHTPKNTLIFGHRRLDPGDLEGYRALVAGTGGHGIALEALLDSLGAEVTADGP